MKLKRPQTGLKVPQIVEDLYRDLRDRHLLPVAIALVAAIVAVPFLLGGGGEEELPIGSGSSVANDGVAEAPEAQPVVLAETPVLRDFEDRLEKFRSRNPFRQQLKKPPKSAVEDLSDSGDAPGGARSDDPGPAPVSGGGGSAGPVSAGPVPSGDGSSGGGGPTGSPGKPELILFEVRVNVRVGPAGGTRKINDVAQFDFLPSRERPIVQYVSGSIDRKRAAFIVNSDVSHVEGDGRCAPRPRRCEFLILKVGDEVKLDYDLEGRTYRLRLDKVNVRGKKLDDAVKLERGKKQSPTHGRLKP
jgi:hypothetical protein